MSVSESTGVGALPASPVGRGSPPVGMLRAGLLTIAVLVASCGGDRRGTPVVHDDAARPRRVIEHPRNRVVALPPHGITSDAVGPYKIGQTLASVLYGVPQGGIEVIDIADVVRTSVVTVEDGRMIVGADPVSITFVGVLAPEVALTDGNVQVGSTRDALVRALGEPVRLPSHATDPRLVAVAKLPGVRFVLERDRVAAALVIARRNEAVVAPSATKVPACAIAALVAANGAGGGGGSGSAGSGHGSAGSGSADVAPALGAALGGTATTLECLTANEALATVGDDVVVISAGDKPRRLFSQRVPGLVFAGVAHDRGRDEILAVTVRRTDKEVAYSLIAAKWEAGRITKTLDEPLYRVTDQGAGWLGVKLADIELVLDLEARDESIGATGVFLGRGEAKGVRLAAPLAPISVARRKRTVPDATGSGGVGDASVQPLGDAALEPDAAPP
jgi:hypothetical protein